MKSVSSIGPLALGIVVALTSGCGTLTIPKYSGGPSAQAPSRESEGLRITADTFSDRQRAETYFHTDPQGDRTIIVDLRAENRSTNATWLLTEESMYLVDAAGIVRGNAHDQQLEQSKAASEAVGYAGAVAISLPMMFASNKLNSDAMVKEKNFVDQEWRNQTLSPGQSASGFIYFRLGKATNTLAGASLRFDCLNTRNQQTNSITIPLAYAPQ